MVLQRQLCQIPELQIERKLQSGKKGIWTHTTLYKVKYSSVPLCIELSTVRPPFRFHILLQNPGLNNLTPADLSPNSGC